METKANVFWKIHEERWSTSPSVELSYDKLCGCTKLALISKTERENPTSLSRMLEPSEALEMANALIMLARKQFEAAELKAEEEQECH